MSVTTFPRKHIFKDELCDVKWAQAKLTCQKGTLKLTGDNTLDFNLYRAWCNDCGRIRVIDRKDFEKNFKSFIKAVDRELSEHG